MNKLDELKSLLSEYDRVAIAFSGGVDSTFLIAVATEVLGHDNVLGINVVSSLQTERERKYIKNFQSDYNYIQIELDAFSIPGLVANEPDRCYHCKKAIFSEIISTAKSNNINYIMDGTNYDDLDDFRPGLKALGELKVISPLKLAKLTKDDVRRYSEGMGLITHDLPSAACIASRIPYGTEISKANLKRVEDAEAYLFDLGYRGFRVRSHDNLARIELCEEDMEKFIRNHSNEVYNAFKVLGFTFTTLDLLGYRMGSQNEVLSKKIIDEVISDERKAD